MFTFIIAAAIIGLLLGMVIAIPLFVKQRRAVARAYEILYDDGKEKGWTDEEVRKLVQVLGTMKGNAEAQELVARLMDVYSITQAEI